MSVEVNTLRDPGEPRPVVKRAPATWRRIEAALDRLSERLNPILVKEARQSLKSRQFAITFALVLICGWGWSLLSNVGMFDFYYESIAIHTLWGYYVVLTVPLIVVVPFTAFRSLAAEREDGTYDLVSITTLSPQQVITGKLGSAVLQMLVYFSALAPCVAFTYLLGEIDILMIGLILYYLFLTSAILSVLALFVATFTKQKHWQIVLSVAVVLVLAALLYWQAWGTGWEIINDLGILPYDNPEFWVGHLAFATAYGSYFVLFFFAAAARITFPSENRATRLRIVMLAQHLLLIGWFTYYWIRDGSGLELIIVGFMWAAVHWYVMGVLMMGEGGRLSPRVRRSLPHSVLGRVFLTWFNPGPGTGYVFAIANLLVAVILVYEAILLTYFLGLDTGYMDGVEAAAATTGAFCYVVVFLGVGRLVMIVVRRFYPVGIGWSVFINVVLLLAAMLGPLLLQTVFLPLHGYYTSLHITNPFWTVVVLAEGETALIQMAAIGPVGVPIILLFPVGGAGLMLIVQLALASRELRQVRVAPPTRVQQDEAELHPAAPTEPRNPWDDG